MAEGNCTGGCCCAPLQHFANPRVSGIHPEVIQHDAFALSASEPSTSGSWGTAYQLLSYSSHLVGLSVFADPGNVATSSDLKGVALVFFESVDPDDRYSWEIHHAVMLEPGGSYTFGDEITGCWYDAGFFVSVTGNTAALGSGVQDDRVLINLSYVSREDYTPAYPSVDKQEQHYWYCNRDEEFKENWYTGFVGDAWEDSNSGEPGNAGIDKIIDIGTMNAGQRALSSQLLDQSGDPVQTQEDDQLLLVYGASD